MKSKDLEGHTCRSNWYCILSIIMTSESNSTLGGVSEKGGTVFSE